MPGVFSPKNGARVGFGVGFCESGSGTEKRKNPVPIENTGFLMELLPGFEPGTSSLPIEPGLIFLVLACCFLKLKGIETTGFFHFRAVTLAVSCRCVPCGFLCCRCGFRCGVLPWPTRTTTGTNSTAHGGDRRSEEFSSDQNGHLKGNSERTAEKAVVTVGRDRGRGWPSG